MKLPRFLSETDNYSTMLLITNIIETMKTLHDKEILTYSFRLLENNEEDILMLFENFSPSFILSSIQEIRRLGNYSNVKWIRFYQSYTGGIPVDDDTALVKENSNKQKLFNKVIKNPETIHLTLVLRISVNPVCMERINPPEINIGALLAAPIDNPVMKNVDSEIEIKVQAVQKPIDRNVLRDLCKVLQRLHSNWPLEFNITIRDEYFLVTASGWNKTIEETDTNTIMALHTIYGSLPIILDWSQFFKKDNEYNMLIYVRKNEATLVRHTSIEANRKAINLKELITHSTTFDPVKLQNIISEKITPPPLINKKIGSDLLASSSNSDNEPDDSDVMLSTFIANNKKSSKRSWDYDQPETHSFANNKRNKFDLKQIDNETIEELSEKMIREKNNIMMHN